MTARHKYALPIIIFLLFSPSISAQETADKQTESNYKYWLNIGTRIDEHNLYFGGIHGSYNFSIFDRYGQTLFTWQKIGKDSGYGEYEPFIASLGIGDRIETRWYLIAGFIGPSWVWGKERSEYPDYYSNYKDYENSFSTFGVNMNLQFILKPLPEIGFGIDFIKNFNAVNNFGVVQYTFSIIINHR